VSHRGDLVAEDRLAYDRQLDMGARKSDGVVSALEIRDPRPKQVDEALRIEKVALHPNWRLGRAHCARR
jgi:hypothetical protein